MSDRLRPLCYHTMQRQRDKVALARTSRGVSEALIFMSNRKSQVPKWSDCWEQIRASRRPSRRDRRSGEASWFTGRSFPRDGDEWATIIWVNLYSLINIHLFLEYIADFFLVVKVLHAKEPFQETRKRPNEALRSSFVWWFSHRFVHDEQFLL